MIRIRSSRHLLRRWLCLWLCLCAGLSLSAQQTTPNEQQARRMFDKIYRQVFDSDGCTLRYSINLVHIYKTDGQVWFRRGLMRFAEKRYEGWVDEQTWRMVDKKKQLVELHKTKSDKTGMKTDDFKFNPDDFRYHIRKESDGGYRIELDLKKGRDLHIKHAQVLLDSRQRPVSLRLKVLFFWATVTLSDYTVQPLPDSTFEYPAHRFRDYKVEDHRADE